MGDVKNRPMNSRDDDRWSDGVSSNASTGSNSRRGFVASSATSTLHSAVTGRPLYQTVGQDGGSSTKVREPVWCVHQAQLFSATLRCTVFAANDTVMMGDIRMSPHIHLSLYWHMKRLTTDRWLRISEILLTTAVLIHTRGLMITHDLEISFFLSRDITLVHRYIFRPPTHTP